MIASLATYSQEHASPAVGALTSENKTLEQLSGGTISKNTYQNIDLGIAYEIPSRWTSNDKDAQRRAISDARQVVWTEDSDPKGGHKPGRPLCAKELLVASQYPEDMRANEFNPFVVMIAAEPKCAPGVGFPTTVNDQAAIQRVASHLGIFFRTASVTSRSASRIHAYDVGGRVILEISQRLTFSTHQPGTDTSQDLQTSVFVAQAGRYWLMWMIVGADDGQLGVLRHAKIFFDIAGPK